MTRPAPPARIRLLGRTINAIAARAPALWPLVRGPMRSFWDRQAVDWGNVDRSSAFHLAPLGAALLHVAEPERAIDIGTGYGDGALLVAREFPHARVRGVDLSEEMVRRATARVGLDPEGRVAFKVADASDLPYDDDSFDLVTQLNMPPFFSEIGRVLRPGGHVAIAATFGPRTPFYTPNAVLRRGFRKAGLEEVDTGTAGEGTWFVARAPG